MAIGFHSQNIHFNPGNKNALRQWIALIAKKYFKITKNIYYIFCDNKYLYEMNVRYLQRKTYTDILTFDYSENDFLSADIFISIDRVKENAVKYQTEFDEELRRVMIHGILHIAGFSDKTKIQRSKMREAENESLLTWDKKFHVKH